MGEIAEMMLDGTMCQGRGEFLFDGEDGPGFAMYCASCQPNHEAAQENYERMFPRASKALKKALCDIPVQAAQGSKRRQSRRRAAQ